MGASALAASSRVNALERWAAANASRESLCTVARGRKGLPVKISKRITPRLNTSVRSS